MTPPVFRRGAFSQLVLTLTSDEPLGLLQTAYIEDVHGVDGQVTLTRPDGSEREVLVTEVGTGHDRFRAFLELGSLPDGLYTVRGTVRDAVGTPAAFTLAFQLAPGLGTVVRLPGATLAGLSRVLAGPLGRTSIRPGRVRALAVITTPRPGQRVAQRPVVVMPLGGPLAPPWHGGGLHLREGL